jgi:hypothetical protein
VQQQCWQHCRHSTATTLLQHCLAHGDIDLNIFFQLLGQNSTAANAVDFCGSAIPSQPPASIERLKGFNARYGRNEFKTIIKKALSNLDL